MSEYRKDIEDVKAKLQKFIDQYLNSTEKGPITDEIIRDINEQMLIFTDNSFSYITDMASYEKTFDDTFSQVINNYKKEEETIKIKEKIVLNQINEKAALSTSIFNAEIDKKKEENKRKTQDLETDITYFYIASSQRETIFEHEYDQNIKRFDYQIDAAKETYNQEIKKNNEMLDKKIIKLNDDFEDVLTAFDNDSLEIIKKIDAKITKATSAYNILSEKLANARNEMKEKFRQESIALNSSIKVLSEEKNKTIDAAKAKYSRSLATSSIKKENKKQEYQVELQKILKDFVYKMNALDDQSNSLKTNNSEQIDSEYRLFFYNLLELNKKQNAEFTRIVKKGSLVGNEFDKQTKVLLKSKKKLYYALQNQIYENKKRSLRNIQVLFQTQLEELRNNKSLFELDKNYKTKILTDKEQRDNKYYQELNNVYENDMNMLIQLANIKFNQSANTIKCQSQIRNKDLEKDLDIIEATYQQQMENVQTKIFSYNLEKDNSISLKGILHDYESNRYKTNLNYLSVSNLIEIEKAKILNQFNYRQYENNIENSKTILAYSKKKLEIQNEKFEAITHIKISKLNEALRMDINDIFFKAKQNEIKSEREKANQLRLTQYLLDSINHNVSQERFKGEIKYMQQVYAVYVQLIKEVEVLLTKIIDIFMSTINLRDKYLDIFKFFFRDLLTILFTYYEDVSNSMFDYENQMIIRRHTFEESFIFKANFTAISNTYEEQRRQKASKRASIKDTLDSYLKTMESFNARIYGYMNQNLVLKQKLKTVMPIEQRALLIEQQRANNKGIEETKSKIKDIIRLRSILENDLADINNDLDKLENNYNNQVKQVQAMQKNNSISYYILKNKLHKHSQIILRMFTKKVTRIATKNYHIHNFMSLIKKNIEKLKYSDRKNIENIYKVFNDFYTNTYHSQAEDNRVLMAKYNSELANIKELYDNQENDNLHDLSKMENAHLAEESNLKKQEADAEKKYNQFLNNNEENFTAETNKLLLEKKQSLERFYKEFYAMSDNLQEINDNHDYSIKSLDLNFETDKQNLANGNLAKKEKLKTDLAAFIKAKEEIINHLPTAVKLQSQELNKENKEIYEQLDIKIKLVKQTANTNRKMIRKNISSINSALEITLIENDVEYQKNITKEKHYHSTQVKKINYDKMKFD